MSRLDAFAKFTKDTASFIIVNVLSPRKSNLTNPAFSTQSLVN